MGAVVQEPNAKTPGILYMWVSPLADNGPVLEPRAFKLPYTRKLHMQIEEGKVVAYRTKVKLSFKYRSEG